MTVQLFRKVNRKLYIDYILLKHGNKVEKSTSNVYIYTKHDPFSITPLISLELQVGKDCFKLTRSKLQRIIEKERILFD